MTSSQYATGLYQSGEGQMLTFAPSTPRDGTRRAVLCLHGHGGDATQFEQYPSAQGAHVKALADAGMLVYSIDAGGPTTFGSNTTLTAISNAYTWLVNSTGGGAHGPKIAIMAWSMGGLGALNWIKSNATKVAGVWLWTPATDLDFFHGTSGYTPAYSTAYTGSPGGNVALGGYTAEIDADYGGSANYATNSAGHRVRDEYSSWNGIGVPIKVAQAPDDNVIPIGQNQSGFVPGVNDPNVTFRQVTSGGHTGLFDQVPTTEVVSFFSGLTY